MKIFCSDCDENRLPSLADVCAESLEKPPNFIAAGNYVHYKCKDGSKKKATCDGDVGKWVPNLVPQCPKGM